MERRSVKRTLCSFVCQPPIEAKLSWGGEAKFPRGQPGHRVDEDLPLVYRTIALFSSSGSIHWIAKISSSSRASLVAAAKNETLLCCTGAALVESTSEGSGPLKRKNSASKTFWVVKSRKIGLRKQLVELGSAFGELRNR